MSRPKLFDFYGVSMTHFFTDNWDEVQNFKAKPDDIVVATYPKAGNLHIICKMIKKINKNKHTPHVSVFT